MSDETTQTEIRIKQLYADWNSTLAEAVESGDPPETFGLRFAAMAATAAEDLSEHYAVQLEDEFAEKVAEGLSESEALRAVLFKPVAESRALLVVSAAADGFKPGSP